MAKKVLKKRVEKTKKISPKPWWKKWWFWLIVILVLVILGALFI